MIFNDCKLRILSGMHIQVGLGVWWNCSNKFQFLWDPSTIPYVFAPEKHGKYGEDLNFGQVFRQFPKSESTAADILKI